MRDRLFVINALRIHPTIAAEDYYSVAQNCERTESGTG